MTTEPYAPIVRLVRGDGQVYHKRASETTSEERAWYVKTSAAASQVAADAQRDKAKTEAILNGDDYYMDGSARVSLQARDKAEWVDAITREIRDSKGMVANAVMRGKVISGQLVARVLSNVPNGLAWDSAKGDVEKMVREEMTGLGKYRDLIAMAIAGAIIIGALALATQIFLHG